jgi:tripartite-type tricarboxylate transporter receptor subunit TctC
VAKLKWLGSLQSSNSVLVTWAGSGVKTLDDAKAQTVPLGGSGATSDSNIHAIAINELLGTKFKVVNGYGTSEMRLAVERGEAEGICGLSYTTLLASSPEWILNKKINILLQTGNTRHPAMPDVPLAVEKAPTEEGKAILRLYSTPEEVGRPFVAPPNVPKDRVNALRRAFDATMKDKGFLADAEKTHLEIDAVTGEDMQKLLEDAYASPPAVIEKVRAVVGRTK